MTQNFPEINVLKRGVKIAKCEMKPERPVAEMW